MKIITSIYRQRFRIFRTFHHLSLLLIVTTCLSPYLHAQEPVPYMLSMIHQYMNDQHVPGMAIGYVTEKSEGLYTLGYADKKSKSKILEHTLFELGEISETFTSAIMIDLYFEEQINIYQPLTNYTPPYVEVPCFEQLVYKFEKPSEILVPDGIHDVPILGGLSCYTVVDTPIIPITFCRLATHHAGLPSYPQKLNKYSWNYSHKKPKFFPSTTTIESLYQMFMQQDLMSRPGTKYHYSNLGVAMLGQLLAYQKSLTYEQLLQEVICDPLGLTHTLISPSSLEQPQIASGYNRSGNTVSPKKWKAFAPATGIMSTPEDMMIYLAANVGVLHAQPLQAALDECHVPHGLITGVKEMEELRTGYGWYVLTEDRGKTYKIWAEGSTEGFSSFMGLIPERKTGVFLLTNSQQNLRQIGFDILDLISNSNIAGSEASDKAEVIRK